jgi:hypothetical protein
VWSTNFQRSCFPSSGQRSLISRYFRALSLVIGNMLVGFHDMQVIQWSTLSHRIIHPPRPWILQLKMLIILLESQSQGFQSRTSLFNIFNSEHLFPTSSASFLQLPDNSTQTLDIFQNRSWLFEPPLGRIWRCKRLSVWHMSDVQKWHRFSTHRFLRTCILGWIPSKKNRI